MTKSKGIRTAKANAKKAEATEVVTPVETLSDEIQEVTVTVVDTPVEFEVATEDIPVEVSAEALPAETPEEVKVDEAIPEKKKKGKKAPVEKVIKELPTAKALEAIRAFVAENEDFTIEKLKDSPHQYFVLFKSIKVMYISPNFLSLRPEDADTIVGGNYLKKGFNHPFQAKLNVGALEIATDILQALETMYPKMPKPKAVKPVKEKKEKVAGEEKPEETKVS